MDTHLIQHDFVADVVDAAMKGKSAEFYQYLSQREELWESLFDSLDDRSPLSPEYLKRLLSKYLHTR
jgi:hypothetical protein